MMFYACTSNVFIILSEHKTGGGSSAQQGELVFPPSDAGGLMLLKLISLKCPALKY